VNSVGLEFYRGTLAPTNTLEDRRPRGSSSGALIAYQLDRKT
jgi:hypothetical protein